MQRPDTLPISLDDLVYVSSAHLISGVESGEVMVTMLAKTNGFYYYKLQQLEVHRLFLFLSLSLSLSFSRQLKRTEPAAQAATKGDNSNGDELAFD